MCVLLSHLVTMKNLSSFRGFYPQVIFHMNLIFFRPLKISKVNIKNIMQPVKQLATLWIFSLVRSFWQFVKPLLKEQVFELSVNSMRLDEIIFVNWAAKEMTERAKSFVKRIDRCFREAFSGKMSSRANIWILPDFLGCVGEITSSSFVEIYWG